MNKNIIIIFSTIISLNFNILAQNENITINFKRNLDNSIDFNYEKKLHGSFYLNIEFGNLSNAYSKNHTAVAVPDFPRRRFRGDRIINGDVQLDHAAGVRGE